jgi:peroxiredoxin/Tfp pilus assembly protein PilF
MTRQHPSRLAVLALAACFLFFGPPAAPAPPEDPPPVHAQKLEEGQSLFEAEKYYEAVRALREADKLAKGSCVECHLELARTFNKLGAWRDALKHAEAALRLAGDHSRIAEAYNEQGLALVALAGEDPKQLAGAEKAFRQVLERTGGRSNAARFNLGYVLLRLSRDAEGVAVLKEYLEKDPQAQSAEAARDLIKNPLRARKRLMPDFELVTLDGTFITSEDLRGKVVLLDFWGTWCGPCVAAVPKLRDWSRRMEKSPFVLLSISTDSDEPVLREFVAKHKMQWPQVWDERHEFARKCQVESYPTYLLVSHEGEILYRTRGWGPHIEQELNGKIFSAIQAAKKSGTGK